MELAVSRAEARLGIRVPDDLLEEARKLTARKMEVKGFPAYYERCFWRTRLLKPVSWQR